MSLKAIATNVKNSQTTQGSNTTLGNCIMTGIFGKSTMLRNTDNTLGSKVSAAFDIVQGVYKLGSALGVRNDMYYIGRISTNSGLTGWKDLDNSINKIKAVYTGKGQEKGVIIDGFDNFKSDINVALPSQPVMYSTDITNQRVRNPNSLTMRIYVSNLNSDDILGGFLEDIKNLAQTFYSTKKRSMVALENLQWIQEQGKPFKVYTPVKVYENMLIEKINPVSDKTTNDMLVADITFREIVFARPLGDISKESARTAPSEIVNTFAKSWNWI